MKPDPHLAFSLEIKIIDLERKMALLEKQVGQALAAQQDGRASHEQALPQSVRDKISNGENPVRAIRIYRLMTQKDLSEKCGIRPNHISAIERGMSFGLRTARRLAEALDVPVDALS